MRVLVYNRSEVSDKQVEQVSLDDLVKNSDVITLHVPFNSDTNNMINSDLLSKKKNDALLINTSRGGLINEFDLQKALLNKLIGGAGLDVLSKEPPPLDHPLLGLENCYITPHQAWASLESRRRLLAGICDNIKSFLFYDINL